MIGKKASPASSSFEDVFSEVRFYPEIGHSPAWAMVPDALSELRKKNLGFSPEQPPMWNDACIVFEGPAFACGFMAYRPDEISSSWFILLSWVAPAVRRTGIHTTLFQALVARAKARGDILAINSGTHVNNLAARRAFESQGRTPVSTMYRFGIRDHVAGEPVIPEEK